jgi:hypothetical protein
MPLGAAIGISAAGMGISAIGQKRAANAQARASEDAGQAQQRAADANAGVEDFNAQVAELQAADAEQRGALDAARFARQVRGLIGTQRASFAASGVDVGFGSAVDVQADAAYLGKEDEATIRLNAQREAFGYRVAAIDSRQRADILRRGGADAVQAGLAAADAQRTAGTLGAVNTIVSGAGSLLAARYGFQNKRS